MNAPPNEMKVILVDDSASDLKLLELFAKKAGLETLSFEDPHQALATALEQPLPSLLICDISMPSMDGFEVLKAIPRFGRYIIAGRYRDDPHQNLSRAWIIAREFGGLQDVRLHDLRHSYASLAAGRGVSLQMIGKLLGHKVPATTQRYAHLARDAVASVNDELGAAMTAAIVSKASKAK